MLIRVLRMVGIGLLIAFGFSLSIPRGQYLGDFECFIVSGRALLAGQPPYAALNAYGYPNLSPPFLLPLWALVSTFDPYSAFRVLYGMNVLAALAIAFILWRTLPRFHGWRVLWLLGSAALWQTLFWGNIYVIAALLAVGGWTLLRSRPVLSGVLVGLAVALKPTFILWPLFLFVTGEVIVSVLATAVGAILALIPAILYGPLIYRDWLHAAAPAEPSRVGYLAIPLVVGAALFLLTRHRRDPQETSIVAIALSLLILPWSGLGYTLFLLPAFGRKMSVPLAVAMALFVIPWFLQSTHTLAIVATLCVLACYPIITAKERAVAAAGTLALTLRRIG